MMEQRGNTRIKMKDPLRKFPRCPSMVLKSGVYHGSPFQDMMKDDTSSSTLSTLALTISSEKSVRFNKKCYLKRIKSRHNYTPQEIKECWYSEEDYLEIRNDCIQKIKTIQLGHKLSGDDDCVRGLDSRTRSAVAIKQQNREDGFWAVLDEQDAGGSPEDIADRYRDVSYGCQLWATAVGRKDHIEAEGW